VTTRLAVDVRTRDGSLLHDGMFVKLANSSCLLSYSDLLSIQAILDLKLRVNHELPYSPPKPIQRLISSQTTRPFSVYASRMADQDKSSLDANKGSVGSQFQPEGNIGQIGEKVGGPFSSQGRVLHQ
jgi:hypothetical protein